MAYKALCIGINDYPGTQNDLSGCVNDAQDWAAEAQGARLRGGHVARRGSDPCGDVRRNGWSHRRGAVR